MAKPTIRDILPPDHRDRRRRRFDEETRPTVDTEGERPDVVSKRPMEEPREEHRDDFRMPPRRRGSKGKYFIWAGGGILGLVIISVLFSIFFGGAEVTVTPKQDSLTVAGDFVAYADATGSGDLPFEIMTLESMQTATLPASGREEVEEKASGQITIFNDFNSSPQRLIRNTRFETPEGLIYRIDESVVVPGQTTEDGETVPGQVEVTVYADEAGEDYNIGLTDFTIPGFRGAEQFDFFYARSNTPMTGGFVGERLVVDEAALEQERERLHGELEAELRGQVQEQQPDGFVSFDSAVFVDFVSEDPGEVGGELEVRERAVLYNVLFPEEALAEFLAVNTLAAFDAENNVTFKEDAVDLSLTPLSDEDDVIRPWETGEFNFSLSGTADIVWLFDEEQLKSDLAGRNKEAIFTVLSGYPSIDEAEVVIRPFWSGSFPETTEDISIETVVE